MLKRICILHSFYKNNFIRTNFIRTMRLKMAKSKNNLGTGLKFRVFFFTFFYYFSFQLWQKIHTVQKPRYQIYNYKNSRGSKENNLVPIKIRLYLNISNNLDKSELDLFVITSQVPCQVEFYFYVSVCSAIKLQLYKRQDILDIVRRRQWLHQRDYSLDLAFSFLEKKA